MGALGSDTMSFGPLGMPALNLGELVIESFIFGNFFLLNIAAMVLMTHREKYLSGRRHFSVAKKPIFMGMVMIMVLVTGHWVCTVKGSFDAYLYSHDGPALYYDDSSLPMNMARHVFLILSLLTADAMMIYRLWIVWGKNRWVVLIPILLILGYVASSIILSIILSRPHVTVRVPTRPWIRVNTVLTLVINIYCTGLITWRIWTSNQSVFSFASSNLNSVIVVIVESAALYTTWTLLYFILHEADSNVQFVFVNLWSLFAGISFSLMNLRVGLNWAECHSSNEDASTLRFGPRMPRQATSPHTTVPLAVHISRAEYRDRESSTNIIPLPERRRTDDKYLYSREVE